MSTTWTPIIGMEIHVELGTNSKMFCGCKNDPFFAPKPNMYTCPVCLGMPGAIPVPNKKAIDFTIMLGLALGCTIELHSKFDRKHYFYPDLAKSYQISQYDKPLCVNGALQTELGPVRIRRVHLEEDTGKLQHTTINGEKCTLVDFNRSGVPLVEIVTEPDIHSAAQAKAYAKAIQELVRALRISAADMEKGSMRLEANISCSQDPKKLPNYKVEVKNINSFRFLEQAINFEVARHIELLESGQTPAQETRGWNEGKNCTIVQRTKEDAEDYRYFPDPDIAALEFTQEDVEALRKQMPELPASTLARYLKLGIKQQFAEQLAGMVDQKSELDALFELGIKQKVAADQIAGYIINKKIDVSSTPAQEIVEAILSNSKKEEVDPTQLNILVKEVIQEQPKAVADFKTGKQQALFFLLGMVMKKIGKKIDPKLVEQALRSELAK